MIIKQKKKSESRQALISIIRVPILLELFLLLSILVLLLINSPYHLVLINTTVVGSIIFLLLTLFYLVTSTSRARGHSYLLRMVTTDEYTKILQNRMKQERKRWDKGLVLFGTAVGISVINGLIAIQQQQNTSMIMKIGMIASSLLVLSLILVLVILKSRRQASTASVVNTHRKIGN